MSDAAPAEAPPAPAPAAPADAPLSISSIMNPADPAAPAGDDDLGKFMRGDDAPAAGDPNPFLEGFTDADTKAYMERKGFKTADDLGKAHAHLERALSRDASGRLTLPTDENDAEGYERAFKALGRPDSAADYGLTDLAGADPAFASSVSEWLFEAGVGKGRVGALAEKWNAYVSEVSTKEQQAFEAQAQADWAGVRSEWGAEFEKGIETFRRGGAAFGLDSDDMGKIERALGTGRTVRLFAKIGQGLAEDTFVNGEGKSQFGISVDQANARIEALKRDQAWQSRWMAGGADEKAEWTRLNGIASKAA